MRSIDAGSERGAVAILVAASLLLLLGAAALAVDVSAFHQTSQSEQRAADLSCLAGALELPVDPEAAFDEAASFLRPNHVELFGIDPNTPTATTAATGTTGEIRTWVAGDTTVEVETPVLYDGVMSPAIMRVTIRQDDPTYFARALGSDSVEVTEEAYCGIFTPFQGGILPVGVPVGFGGGIIKFNESLCNDESVTNSGSGVCNYLDINRRDGNAGGTTGLTYNLILGSDWPLGCHNNSNPQCGLPADVTCTNDPDLECNQVLSKSGNVAGAIFDGMIGGRGDLLGRLAFSDSGISGTPGNPHDKPATTWSTWSRSGNADIEWNSSTINIPNDASCTAAANGTDYFDDRWPGPPDPAGYGSPPPTPCYEGEVDDQPPYLPSGQQHPNIDYESPPDFVVSRFDCRDMRFVVMPEGNWGPPQNNANDRLFTIRGYLLGYVVDPIPEEGNDGDRNFTISQRNLWNILAWEDANGMGAVGDWGSYDYRSSSLPNLSALAAAFVLNADGEPDPEVTGDCASSPLSPPLAGIVPSFTKLVPPPGS